MSALTIVGSIAIGWFAGFINHQIGDWTFQLKLKVFHQVPAMFYRSQLYRGFLYMLVASLTVAAAFLSPHWLVTGLIVVWVISSWKSGYHAAFMGRVKSLTKYYMEKEGLSEEKAEEKAKEAVKINIQYS